MEHCTGIAEVLGSNPVGDAKFFQVTVWVLTIKPTFPVVKVVHFNRSTLTGRIGWTEISLSFTQVDISSTALWQGTPVLKLGQ